MMNGTRQHSVTVSRVSDIDDDLVEAIGALLPQLSSTARPLVRRDLLDIVEAPGTVLLIARDASTKGPIVGMLTFVSFRIPSGIRAWIEDVVVDQAARGTGVGEALTRVAITLARERGARTIELTSRPHRVAATALYRKLGFEPRETTVYRLTL